MLPFIKIFPYITPVDIKKCSAKHICRIFEQHYLACAKNSNYSVLRPSSFTINISNPKVKLMKQRLHKYLVFCLVLALHNILSAQDYLWQDTFPRNELNVTKWTVISGNPVMSTFFGQTSGDYALKLKSGDILETKNIYRADYEHLVLKFQYLSHNTEAEDSLIIKIKVNDAWRTVVQISGGADETEQFTTERILLPAIRLADSLKIRISAACDDVFEAWYLDNIELSASARLEFTPQPNPFSLTGAIHENVNGKIELANTGMDDFLYFADYQPNSINTQLLKIAVLGSHRPEHLAELLDVAEKIRATGTFAQVDTINALNYSPSLDQFLPYDALLVCPREYFQSKVALGDTLAMYMKSGPGGVVLTITALTGQYLAGGFSEQNFYTFYPNYGWKSSGEVGQNLGEVIFPAHPVLKNVKQLHLPPRSKQAKDKIITGAIRLARWSNGYPLAVAKIIDGCRRVDLALNPVSSDADSTGWDADSTDTVQLLTNSLKWVAQNRFVRKLQLSKNIGNLQTRHSDSILVQPDPLIITPDSLHTGQIHLYTNILDNPDTSIAISFLLRQPDYSFVTHQFAEQRAGRPDSTVFYPAYLVNQGKMIDSYQLKSIRSNWPVSFWDTTKTQIISQIQHLAPADTAFFKVAVKIPADVLFGKIDSSTVALISLGDPTLQDTLRFQTSVHKLAHEIPWVEDFSTRMFDSLKWSYISEAISNNSFYDTHCEFTLQGEIISQPIWLAGQTDIQLSYLYGGPEIDDSSSTLSVQGFDGTDWHDLAQHQAYAPKPEFYDFHQIYLNQKFLTNEFRLRFAVNTPSRTYWYVDIIKLIFPPQIVYTTSPEILQLTSFPVDSVKGEITLTNTGGYEFNYKIDIIDAFAGGNSGNLEPLQNNIVENILKMKLRWAKEQQDKTIQNGKSNNNRLLAPGEEVFRFEQNSLAATSKNIAILGCEHLPDVLEKVNNTNTFESVTAINARVFLPTFNELTAFDAVFVYSGLNFGFYFTDSLGNVLADYIETGRGVVLGGAVFKSSGNQGLKGRFSQKNYYIIPQGSYRSDYYDSMRMVISYHPILQNIHSLNGNYYSWRPRETTLSSETVAVWSKSGGALIAVKEFNGARRVDLGFLPYSSDVDSQNGWLVESDGAQIMANALAWAAEGELKRVALPDMTTFLPAAGTVPPKESRTIQFRIDPAQAQLDKTYPGYFIIKNNEFQQIDSLALSLTVHPVPYYFEIESDSLSKNGLFGEQVRFHFNLLNRGTNTDSYNLQPGKSRWPVSMLDHQLSRPLTILENIQPDSLCAFVVAMNIPDSSHFNETDSVLFTISSQHEPARLHQFLLKVSTRWKDEFKTGEIDTTRWRIVRGSPKIHSYAENEISPPYSLRMPGNAAIETNPFNFSHSTGHEIYLKYFSQNDGTSENDDLIIFAYSGRYWLELKRLSGLIDDYDQFLVDSIQIIDEFMQDEVKFRFATEFKQGYWYLDDVELVDHSRIIKTPQSKPESEDSEPLVYALQSNYPNPFNPSTQIKYSLAGTGKVRLTIFNVLGQKAVTLVDHTQKAGRYRVNWEAARFSAGLYFCLLEANGFRAVIKMLLLK